MKQATSPMSSSTYSTGRHRELRRRSLGHDQGNHLIFGIFNPSPTSPSIPMERTRNLTVCFIVSLPSSKPVHHLDGAAFGLELALSLLERRSNPGELPYVDCYS